MATTLGVMAPAELLNDFSLEITAKDGDKFREAASFIPQGTQVSVTFLPGEEFDMRVATVKLVKQLGFVPMPHLSARRLQSRSRDSRHKLRSGHRQGAQGRF